MKYCSPSIAPIVKGDSLAQDRHCILVGMLGDIEYLQGTKDYMLMYRRTDNLEVIGYSIRTTLAALICKINFKICLYASRWSCFLEKCKANFDCNFHYGG
ncbi:hypothetical protein AAG906_016878 [Vitis piasezkii]